MKTEKFESTYALLVRSDEMEKSVSEIVVYFLLIAMTAFSIWQAAHQPVTVPNSFGTPSFAQAAKIQQHNA